jgi:GT2 family glycosyltransferase
MKRVYVLIVNWNGWTDTVECLESVLRLDYPDYRVIVCDNGSKDGSLARIVDWAEGHSIAPASVERTPHHDLVNPPVEKPLSYVVYDRPRAEDGGDGTLDPRLVLIRTGGNLCFAGGNNVGLRYALARGDFEHVWLLNNDTVVTPGSLSALVARMTDKPSSGMCGSTLALYDRPDRIQARGGGWYCRWTGLPWHIGQLEKTSTRTRLEHVEKWMNYVVGASMLVSREFLAEVGLMCEDYFLYFEETDWIQRAAPHFSLAYAPQSLVYHKVGGSIGTSSKPWRKSRTCDFYAIRNRLLFTRRFHREALPAIYLSVMLALLVRLLVGNWSRAGMIWRLLRSRDLLREAEGLNGQS